MKTAVRQSVENKPGQQILGQIKGPLEWIGGSGRVNVERSTPCDRLISGETGQRQQDSPPGHEQRWDDTVCAEPWPQEEQIPAGDGQELDRSGDPLSVLLPRPVQPQQLLGPRKHVAPTDRVAAGAWVWAENLLDTLPLAFCVLGVNLKPQSGAICERGMELGWQHVAAVVDVRIAFERMTRDGCAVERPAMQVGQRRKQCAERHRPCPHLGSGGSSDHRKGTASVWLDDGARDLRIRRDGRSVTMDLPRVAAPDGADRSAGLVERRRAAQLSSSIRLPQLRAGIARLAREPQ